MPYSNPTPVSTTTEIAPPPLPVHSQGRPGHRRSVSYTQPDGSWTQISNAAAPHPGNGSTSRGPSTAGPSSNRESSNAVAGTGAFSPLNSLPRRKPASFHIAAEEEEDDSSSSSSSSSRFSRSASVSPSPPPPTRSSHFPPTPAAARFSAAPHLRPTLPGRPSLNTDDEDDGRGLPPLKLKIPSLSGSGIGSGNFERVPFPHTASPAVSPPRSRSSSNAATHPPQALPMVRTSSGHSILLANGKPLKSSLKSSSSSPNIPFPSQSLVPSRLYAELAAAQQALANGDGSTVSEGQRHARAASAPNLPNLPLGLSHPRSSLSIDSTSDEYGYYSMTAPSTPGAPKAVHFPDLDADGKEVLDGDDILGEAEQEAPGLSRTSSHGSSSGKIPLASIRLFKRSAKPKSLNVPGASEGETETETEFTDGEYGGGAYHYAVMNSWGSGYSNPWDRSTRQAANATSTRGPNGYPFPRTPSSHLPRSSPLGKGQPLATLTTATTAMKSANQTSSHTNGASSVATSTKMAREKRRIVYELDNDITSQIPKVSLGLFDVVFVEGVHLVCSKIGSAGHRSSSFYLSSSPPSTSSDSSSSEELDGPTQPHTAEVSSSLDVKLEGTMLVRNLAYEKHVSVRFTLDDWHTTSEVSAAYVESLGSMPDRLARKVTGTGSVNAEEEAEQRAKSVTPQWDRFKFTLNLSDYARSRSLAGRTLWMVTRYAVPGGAVTPIPIQLPGFNFSELGDGMRTPSSSVEDLDAMFKEPRQHQELTPAESELLGRCDPAMVNMIVAGIWASEVPTSSNTFLSEVAVKKMVLKELARRRVGVGASLRNEWWDNNGSGNYKVGFREIEIVTAPRVLPVQGSTSISDTDANNTTNGTEAHNEESHVPAQQRRKNTLSFPPSSSSSTPAGLYARPYSSLSPPQLSASTSLDSGSNTRASGSLATGVNPSVVPRTAETNKAVAQTTFERLKRLNLRNYAAPSLSGPNVGGDVKALPATASMLRQYAPPALGATGRTSSNPLPMSSANSVHRPANGPVLVVNGHNGHAPSTRSVTSSISSASSGTSTTDSTPLTSPLQTPILNHVEVVVAGEDQQDSHLHGITDHWAKQQDDTAKLQPSLTRAAIIATSTSDVAPDQQGEESGANTPTVSGVRALPAMSSTNARSDQLSPLLEPLIAGGVMASIGGVLELGASPPFSSMAEGFAASTTGSSGVARRQADALAGEDKVLNRASAPSSSAGNEVDEIGLPLAPGPRQIMLENIREKSTSSPARSPIHSGRNSPIPSPRLGPSSVVAVASSTLSPVSSTGSISAMMLTPTLRSGINGSVQSPRGGSPVNGESDLGVAAALKGQQRRIGVVGSPPMFSPPIPSVPPTSPTNMGDSSSSSSSYMALHGGSADDITDPDSIYQAFVRQWCFASGPSPAQAGGFGGLHAGQKA